MKPWLSFDVESSGEKPEFALQSWRVKQRRAYLTTAAFSYRSPEKLLVTKGIIFQQGDKIYHERTKDQLKQLLRWIIEKGFRVIGWNIVFDLAWIIAYDEDGDIWELVNQIDWFDVMLLWRHLYRIPTFAGSFSYALDAANKKFEKSYAGYKAEGPALYHDTRPHMRARLLKYNKDDAEVTLLHCERFWPQLTPEQQRCCLIESKCLDHVARANVTGMRVDLVARAQLDKTLRDVGHAMAEYMAPLGVTEQIVRSPKRTATLLYKKWGLPVLKYNDITDAARRKAEETGVEPVQTPSTDKEVLYELGLDDERVLNFQRWREALNLNSKFMGGLRKSVEYNDETDRTYPQSKVNSTYTGRFTIESKQSKSQKSPQIGFAQHQMKRDPRFRNCIRTLSDDEDLVEFDAASQEFKFMAILSGDPVMLDLCQPGGDPHSFMTAQIHAADYVHVRSCVKDEGHDEHKLWSAHRKGGKVANLSLQYRTSRKRLRVAARVQYNIPMTADEAAHIWTTYRQSYVGVPMYWKRQIQLGKQVGYAETLAGRRVQIEGDWTGEYKWSMESTMINHPIQGTGGDQKYLAIACLEDTMLKYDARFAWDLHDGLYFYVKKTKTLMFVREALAILDNLPYKKAWGFTSPIPHNWDCKVGDRWGDMKEPKL